MHYERKNTNAEKRHSELLRIRTQKLTVQWYQNSLLEVPIGLGNSRGCVGQLGGLASPGVQVVILKNVAMRDHCVAEPQSSEIAIITAEEQVAAVAAQVAAALEEAPTQLLPIEKTIVSTESTAKKSSIDIQQRIKVKTAKTTEDKISVSTLDVSADIVSAAAAVEANAVDKAESNDDSNFGKVATEKSLEAIDESTISQLQIPIPRIPSIGEVLLPNALNIPPVSSTLAAALHAQMTSVVQQQQHEKQQHHFHQLHTNQHQNQSYHSHQHEHHEEGYVQHSQHQLQQQIENEQHQQLFHQHRSQLFKMDAEFWQQARGPFGLHTAAALATNQLHHHHQQNPQQHHPQQSHSAQQQHNQPSVQTQHTQQPPHLSNVTIAAVPHHEQQHQQSSSTLPALPPHEQHHQNHHLLFNAAAAAAAAVHLSGVVKSNEMQNVTNGIIVSGLATNSPSTHDGSAVCNNNVSGNRNSSCNDASGSSEPLRINVKHEMKAVAASVATSNQHQQQQSKYQPNMHNAIDALHHQLQQQLQQQNLASSTSAVDETDAFKNQLKAQPVSGLSSSSSVHQQHTHAQNSQSRPHNSTHEHHQQQEQQHQQLPSQTLSQLQQSNGQQREMGTGRSSPPLVHSGVSGNALVPLHSPQHSMTPSVGSSTPDIKYNSDKLVNEIQLQLSRSNSAAAISERTLEECWSTLQRLFMHKSAMQQIQQIPRVGLGAPGSMAAESKPHQCQQCMKSFSSNHQLVQHIRVHTGEKPYKCSYCDRRFKQLSHVQQHTRLHT
ncbi:PREDICTED: G-box-binding factor-like, partial [Bactrocera latifrons]|uniref:G-box-binding factor-like n=1 Tax=Bactrocera latifrons TaxID=174628 RepID=UPI0008DDF4BF